MRFLVLLAVAAAAVFGAETFSGKWASDRNEGSGGIRITLKPEPKVSFTLDGQEVACTVASSKAEGESIEIAYDFILQGYKLRSTLKGTVREGKLSGKYESKVTDDGTPVDSGSFDGSAHE
jgi:hypothetical protein